MKVAGLGTGIMGAVMARNLLRAGHDVTVWNRTPEPAAAVGREGAAVADSPREAAAEARTVLTVLADWNAVESVMTGPERALRGMDDDAIWLQLSTVGIPRPSLFLETIACGPVDSGYAAQGQGDGGRRLPDELPSETRGEGRQPSSRRPRVAVSSCRRCERL